jgi:hypothetical protein
MASVILIGSMPVLPVQADSTAALRKTLQSLYDQSCAAIARKDIAGATAIDTTDYVFVDDKGRTHTLAESRERATQLFSKPQIIKSTAHIDKVTLEAKNAVAEVAQHLYMKYTNPRTHHVFITDQVSTTKDVWIKQGATWRRSRGQSRSVRVTVNGKLMYNSKAR